MQSPAVTGRLIHLLFAATLGPFLFGYHLAELNAPQDLITCARDSDKSDAFYLSLPCCIPMNPLEIGLISSIYTHGGLIGALTSGPLSARYGRLPIMRVGSIIFIIGGFCAALAPSIAILSLGRFISGLAAGSATVVVPLYISEIAPPSQRGLFGALTQILTCSGIIFTQVLGFFLSHRHEWRIILIAAGGIGAIQFVALVFSSESPQWQASHGWVQDAIMNLQRIRGQGVNIFEEIHGWETEQADPEQQQLLSQHLETHVKNKDENMGIFQVFRDRKTCPAVMTAIMVMAAQQLCGISSIVMYGVSLLSTLFSSSSAILNIFVSILNLIVTTSCSPLPEILGRKACILSSIAGMGVSSILLSIGIRASIPILSAVATICFVASFGSGLGPVPFILSSELVGPEAVGATQSWALASSWISTFIVAQLFPIVNEKLGQGLIYLVFAGFTALFFAFISWWVPETKGKKNADEVWGRQDTQDD